MEKILKWLYILQEVSNKNRVPHLGRGFLTAKRFNSFNPLSYVVLLITLIIGIVLFGFIGFFQKCKNPFKWD